ncbi:sporulation integral membrane protein YtvI [Paenibacillus alvei]|uniref:Sporulation integral membrane protein YtvI n=1 Tax=Paenibacillus alvei TaxID=44250 RepID=A0ABT4GZL8_PAEAL|nr:sporulation integral membrane protein YtvI [Paenibacillus alvei]MCY9762172.1 sporulation integral membrane protein YtvI [Paenibacillus alvei]MCY9770362.1 sporulation integral membrane protein YtvI [Paenibacillus alvei]
MEQHIIKRILRGGWVLTIGLLMILSCYILIPLIYPFLIAWMIALMLNPVVQWMSEQFRMPRWLSVTICLTLFITSMLTVAVAAVTRIVREIYNLSVSMDHFLQLWREFFIRLFENDKVRIFLDTLGSLYKDNPNLQGSINSNLSSTAEKITTVVTNLITSFLDAIVRLLSSLPNVASISIIILLSAFFISKDWTRWMNIPAKAMPDSICQPLRTIWSDLKQALFGYLRAQLFLISITMFIITAGLIVLRVDYAITIGLLIGIVDLLPYLGVGAVMIPWIIYCFAIDQTSLGIGLSIVYGIVLFTRQIMEPKVLASTVGLDPLLLLVAMFVGMQLFGFLGLIVGPVALVLLSAMKRANVFQDLRTFIMNGKN